MRHITLMKIKHGDFLLDVSIFNDFKLTGIKLILHHDADINLIAVTVFIKMRHITLMKIEHGDFLLMSAFFIILG